MNKAQKTEIFKNYRALIEKIAWKYHYKSGIEIEELDSIGYLSFLECIDKYDEEKGKLSTWIISCTNNALRSYISDQNKCPEYIPLNENLWADPRPIKECTILNDLITNADPIMSAIGKVIKKARPEDRCVKYGWLDKKVHALTGIKFSSIWATYPQVNKIIREG